MERNKTRMPAVRHNTTAYMHDHWDHFPRETTKGIRPHVALGFLQESDTGTLQGRHVQKKPQLGSIRIPSQRLEVFTWNSPFPLGPDNAH